MIAFVIKTQARINDANYASSKGKWLVSSNLLKIEHLFPFIAINFGSSVSVLSGNLHIYRHILGDCDSSKTLFVYVSVILTFIISVTIGWVLIKFDGSVGRLIQLTVLKFHENRLNNEVIMTSFLITPPRNCGGVIFSLQFVCLSVCVCVCMCVY